jgi:8-oxo-dGTP pyrophosphatase MutT (NUDIX family)
MKTPSEPRAAATILLVRNDPEFEVLMVKRHHQIDFASGALVFPGGKIDPADSHEAWADYCHGWTETPEDERVLRIAAIREAFEEAGVLLARTHTGERWGGDERVVAAQQSIANGNGSFLELIQSVNLRLDLGALVKFARWITPENMPKRFDTWFYLARAPHDQLAICDGREAVDAEWIRPGHALELAQSGQRTIIFPTRMNLKLLAESDHPDAAEKLALARADVTVLPWIEQRPHGKVLVIQPDAGYGAVEEDLESVGA